MRVVLVAVALFICFVCAQGPPPGNCCAPQQMEGYVTGMSFEQQSDFSEYFYYDHLNNRARFDVVFVQNSGPTVVESTLYRHDLVIIVAKKKFI